MAELAGVGAGDRIGTSAGATTLGGVGPMGWRGSLSYCQSKTSFSLSDEKLTPSVLPALADGLAWNGLGGGGELPAGGGDGGVLGAEPKGESGVASLLTGMAAGVMVGMVVAVWLDTGTTGGEAAGVGCASAGADGHASSGSATGPCFSVVYLSPGLVGTAALLQSAEIRQGKAKIPLSFLHAAASSWAKILPTLMRYPVMMVWISTSRVWSTV
ncbi:hypothetical protein V6N11_001631 [Hibiscus sabdariffa]|uniref:Uncharacterized protein n=1 Tax=Hibiscus sabdariffa TaxID=183260 RepID=A0ABR2NK97_9ROSI